MLGGGTWEGCKWLAGLPGWVGWDPCQLRQVRALVSGPAGLSRPVWGPPNSQQQHPSLHPSYQGHKTHSFVSLEPSALLHASFPHYMPACLHRLLSLSGPELRALAVNPDSQFILPPPQGCHASTFPASSKEGTVPSSWFYFLSAASFIHLLTHLYVLFAFDFSVGIETLFPFCSGWP